MAKLILTASQKKLVKKWKRLNKPQISQELRDILHGYIMSDGHVKKEGNLAVDQGQEQKPFVEWMYSKLKPLRTSTSITEVVRIHSKTGKKSVSYRFFTRNFLGGFRNMWYKPIGVDAKGKTIYEKQLPESIDCFFTSTFISLWYAGDGTKLLDSKGVKFEVTAFSEVERLKLQSLFLRKFGISTSIISSGHSSVGNKQWALRIPADEYDKFHKLITKIDLIPKIFSYKLHSMV